MQEAYQITETLIRKLEQSTGLLYVEKPIESSVCFARQNNNLRDDYKEIFTHEDIVNFLKSSPGTDMPDCTTFWKQVAIGKQGL